MNCNEARRMVTPFVNKELSDKETELFLDHIENCSECKDELDVYFTVYRALDFLDSGTHHDFDFVKMLESEIQVERQGILRRKMIRVSKCLLLLLVEVFLLVSVFIGYAMKQGEISRIMLQRAIHRLYLQSDNGIPKRTNTTNDVSELQDRTEIERIIKD